MTVLCFFTFLLKQERLLKSIIIIIAVLLLIKLPNFSGQLVFMAWDLDHCTNLNIIRVPLYFILQAHNSISLFDLGLFK